MRFVVLRFLLPVALLAIGALIYGPGLHGPFIFDDYSNLLDDPYLRITSFDLAALWRAAFSQAAGPLQRPVAMASFAINSYFAGGFVSPVPYRAVNIAVHLVNGILVYWLLHLVIDRYRHLYPPKANGTARSRLTSHSLAAALAFVWLVHPINLTSVLYIVQRMTSLSALFVLSALVSYLHGRLRARTNALQGYSIMGIGLAVFGVLGIFTKENALLLPVFVVILDILLFRDEQPWKRWDELPGHIKRWSLAALVLLFAVALFLAIEYALPTYRTRTFTMGERLLTQSRVLVAYLSLIAFPRLDSLGMFHDDIPISHSLLNPPTTLLSILALAGMVGIAIAARRRAPLITLGVAWFFAAHLLESTIFSLEMAHEHRNYLASLILPFLGAALALKAELTLHPKWRLTFIYTVAATFAIVTYFRASQWSDDETLYASEVRHHPDSPRANEALGRVLVNRGRMSEGLAVLQRAVTLEPTEAGTLINIVVYTAETKQPIDRTDTDSIGQRLATYPATASTDRALLLASICVIDKCRTLAPHLEQWMRTLLQKRDLLASNRSYYYQFLARALMGQGKAQEAIDAYFKSYDLDAGNIVSLVDIAQIYLANGQVKYAEAIASEIRRANARVLLSRDAELAALESQIANAKMASSK